MAAILRLTASALTLVVGAWGLLVLTVSAAPVSSVQQPTVLTSVVHLSCQDEEPHPECSGLVTVPNLVGLDEWEAVNELADVELQLGNVSRTGDTVQTQDPATGKHMPSGTPVSIDMGALPVTSSPVTSTPGPLPQPPMPAVQPPVPTGKPWVEADKPPSAVIVPDLINQTVVVIMWPASSAVWPQGG
jgi:hypothetical protein